MGCAFSELGSAYRSDIWRESWRPQQPLWVLGFRQQAYRLLERRSRVLPTFHTSRVSNIVATLSQLEIKFRRARCRGRESKTSLSELQCLRSHKKLNDFIKMLAKRADHELIQAYGNGCVGDRSDRSIQDDVAAVATARPEGDGVLV